MKRRMGPQRRWANQVLLFSLLAGIGGLCVPQAAIATVFDWDNYSGDSSFATRINWNPYPLPANVPGPGDTAIFDGQLIGAGVGNNGVNAANGTAIYDMQVIDTAVVNMTIGGGTGRFDLNRTSGDSLVVGDSFGDTATLNLLGGTLDTFAARVGGQATVNITGANSNWDSTSVLINGDTVSNTAGVGLGLQARIVSHGNLDVGSDTGSGRVVVDGTTVGVGTPSLWTVTGSVDVGPTGTTSFNFGQITLQAGGQMSVQGDFDVHGTMDVASTGTVRTGGELTVQEGLEIGSYGRLELHDPASRIETGTFSKTGVSGVFDWTAGTLEITDEFVALDNLVPHSVLGSSLAIGSGQKLTVSTIGSYSLEVGFNGTGALTIENGGDVECYRGTVGNFETSSGEVTVRDPGSTWTINEQLRVGQSDSSHGQLDIQNGASVSAISVDVGEFDNATGTVIVDGLNSSLICSGSMWVADSGSAKGTLTIQNQGTVTSANAWVGRLGTPTGAIVVDGATSHWTNTQSATVGNNIGGSGSLTVQREGHATIGGTLSVQQTGTVELNTGGVIEAGNVSLAGGRLQGTGTMVIDIQFTNAGVIAPGLPVGLLNLDGNYVQQTAGTLAIEIGGTSSSEYDRLRILGGSAALAGTLDVKLVNGFVPALGDVFTVLTFGSRSNDFTSYLGLEIGGGLVLRPSYTFTSLRLKARPAIDGDVNLDGVVDIFDVNLVSDNWGGAGPLGDANDDGVVDIFDVNTISDNWGATSGSAQAVPEPASSILAICALLGATLLRGRHNEAQHR